MPSRSTEWKNCTWGLQAQWRQRLRFPRSRCPKGRRGTSDARCAAAQGRPLRRTSRRRDAASMWTWGPARPAMYGGTAPGTPARAQEDLDCVPKMLDWTRRTLLWVVLLWLPAASVGAGGRIRRDNPNGSFGIPRQCAGSTSSRMNSQINAALRETVVDRTHVLCRHDRAGYGRGDRAPANTAGAP